MIESFLSPGAVSVSVGLGHLDGALAMAAYAQQCEVFRLLIGQGANPAVCNWLPMKTAAGACKIELLCELIELDMPSASAFAEARRLATQCGRVHVVAELDMAQALHERDALAEAMPCPRRESFGALRL